MFTINPLFKTNPNPIPFLLMSLSTLTIRQFSIPPLYNHNLTMSNRQFHITDKDTCKTILDNFHRSSKHTNSIDHQSTNKTIAGEPRIQQVNTIKRGSPIIITIIINYFYYYYILILLLLLSLIFNIIIFNSISLLLLLLLSLFIPLFLHHIKKNSQIPTHHKTAP